MNANTILKSIPADVRSHLAGITPTEVIALRCMIDGRPCEMRAVSGGFGLPAWIATVSTSNGAVELGLIERDGEDYDGEQDGSEPLQVYGWAWREYAGRSLIGGRWSSTYHSTAAEALAEAMLAIA